MTEFDPTHRQSYHHWTPVTIRYSDQDSMAHVNNCAFAAYVEAARTIYISELIRRAGMEGFEFILARLVIDYHRELHYPGTVEVGSRLVRIGNKSLTTHYGVFQGDTCYATSECVNVFYDMATRRSALPDARIRAALEAELAG